MLAAVYGSRSDGHARVVIELLMPAAGLRAAGLIDDVEGNERNVIGAVGVIGTGDDLERLRDDGIEAVALGFGVGRGRTAIVERVLASGLQLPPLVHPTATVAPTAELGAGCQLLPGSFVGPGARLGRGTLVNTGAIVEHDCNLEDGAVVYSGAVLAGRVRAGSDAEVGAGAVLVPDIHLGVRSRVGAGSVVIADVADEVTVAGVPARPTEPH